ncbi:hypothetical protein KCP71_22125 [Salmonella enterica subsp. enterica]|nr:hypothetical protein KCP71_22125 [Salmonella enterica subsp. enterica]
MQVPKAAHEIHRGAIGRGFAQCAIAGRSGVAQRWGGNRSLPLARLKRRDG